MRWSQSFLPTLREDPADAEVASHRLMLRAGYIRQLGSGVYSHLPLAERVMRRIERIIREEMQAIGAQQFTLPSLHPAEIWRETGRWDEYGKTMFQLRDRKGAELCLGPTHEEIFCDLARRELRSYRQLPQIWYQIRTKFRDEPRPKSGVLRGREFTMKDSYSFDSDADGLERAFRLHHDAYHRIYARCGLEAIAVEASSGAMGGSESVEFMAVSDAGEDWVVRCAACGYAANLEKATSLSEPAEEGVAGDTAVKFATPGVRSIEDLERFEAGVPASAQIKTLCYMVRGEPMLFLLRGDHELGEVKAIEATGTTDLRPAQPDEIRAALGAAAGSLGAVGVTGLPILADDQLRGRRGMTTGANENDFHLRHVDVERDIPNPVWVELRQARAGERCSACEEPGLAVQKTIEIGHIFKLGTRYSEPMGARVLTADGKEVPVFMGSYGIGLERIMAAAIEARHDEAGIVWPQSIAPFDVILVLMKTREPEHVAIAEQLYRQAAAAGLEPLLDDRDERPGVKFKDADLIGVPWRLVLGPRSLAKGKLELFERATGHSQELPVDDAIAELAQRIST
jgi:prolyl-tRNA synthetase